MTASTKRCSCRNIRLDGTLEAEERCTDLPTRLASPSYSNPAKSLRSQLRFAQICLTPAGNSASITLGCRGLQEPQALFEAIAFVFQAFHHRWCEVPGTGRGVSQHLQKFRARVWKSYRTRRCSRCGFGSLTTLRTRTRGFLQGHTRTPGVVPRAYITYQMVFPVRYIPRHTAGIYRRSYRASETSVSSVRHQYRYRTLRQLRYDIHTGTENSGTMSNTPLQELTEVLGAGMYLVQTS